MYGNQFVKVTLESSEICYINISHITRITTFEGNNLIYVVGEEKGIIVKEPIDVIINMLPPSLGYENI